MTLKDEMMRDHNLSYELDAAKTREQLYKVLFMLAAALKSSLVVATNEDYRKECDIDNAQSLFDDLCDVRRQLCNALAHTEHVANEKKLFDLHRASYRR